MIRVHLLADTEYFGFFSSYLGSFEGIEFVGIKPDILFDASFLHPHQKLAAISKLDLTDTLTVSNSLTVSATTAQKAAGAPNVIGMPLFPHYFERQNVIEYSYPVGTALSNETLENFLALLGKTGEKVEDSIAGIFPRTLAMIVNEAAFAIQEGVALAEDIDIAMKLGTNYPQGPLAWCDEIGADSVVAVLDALASEYSPDRYRVSTLLRRKAEARLKFFGNF